MSALDDFLIRSGLAPRGTPCTWVPLTGGVSSDIWRVDIPGRNSVCVKRALATLKVADLWEAPVSRNAYEWAWMQFAAGVVPDAVPALLAHDTEAGLFAMEYLAAERYPIWKQQLLSGHVEPATARQVGDVLGRIHSASAHRTDLRAAFDTTDNFHAIRLEPYLAATARRHPGLAQRLHALIEQTAATRIALVHGDVSPKNILVGPRGPVFLDAECAWFGDPGFDLAFCLNHLLLKCLVQPGQASALHASFDALIEAYFSRARFESRSGLEARAAALLPALLLARVDGKSPLEYLTRDAQRDAVRQTAIPLIERAPVTLQAIGRHWFDRAPGFAQS